jgi:hypothetical protein
MKTIVLILCSIVAGFALGGYYSKATGYGRLLKTGATDSQIKEAILAAPKIVSQLHAADDLGAMRLAIIYKQLLLKQPDVASVKLREMLDEYYREAKLDANPTTTRTDVIKSIEELNRLEKTDQ